MHASKQSNVPTENNAADIKPLTAVQMASLYGLVIILASVCRYLIFPFLFSFRYERYFTNIALELSIVLATAGVVVLKPYLVRLISLRISLLQAVVAIAAGLLAANLSTFVVSLEIPKIPEQNLQYQGLILLLAVAPLVEEIFFRGLLLESLSRRYSVVTSILVSSIIFASFHTMFWSGLIGGVVLGCVYLGCSRSLTASIFAHLAGNLVGNGPAVILLYTHYLAK